MAELQCRLHIIRVENILECGRVRFKVANDLGDSGMNGFQSAGERIVRRDADRSALYECAIDPVAVDYAITGDTRAAINTEDPHNESRISNCGFVPLRNS